MPLDLQPIESSNDNVMLEELCDQLRELSSAQDEDSWPAAQLQLCGSAGVFRWFVPRFWDGYEWNDEDVIKGYLKLSSACLKTTFVITQRTAACRRIAASANDEIKNRLLPDLASGKIFATVGISHLTTSRRHIGKPVLHARETETGFVVNGFSPWVTGASAADYLVMGAEIDEGRQILFVVSIGTKGLIVDTGQKLVALTGSQTGAVRCEDVFISKDCVLSGPVQNVMSSAMGTATGGFQTSTLAIGLASAAIDFIANEARQRPNLTDQFQALNEQLVSVQADLLSMARGEMSRTKDELRIDANSLVLRATQSALVAAKGSGYVQGHPVGRWCKEALFFLVWSCPQSVLDANLCELVGTSD